MTLGKKKKKHLKAIVIQTVRIYTNYSAMSLSCSRDITSIKTHMPNTLKEPKLMSDLQLVSALVLGDNAPQSLH